MVRAISRAAMEMNHLSQIRAIISELGFALRRLRKNLGFAAGVVVILALAIGANTAVFSITSAVLLRPLPWAQADRLVYVWNTAPLIGWPMCVVSVPDYLDRRSQTEAFADSALVANISASFATATSADQLNGLKVTPSFFSTLGALPLKGRAFTADEGIAGGEKVAIISFAFWQRQFGGSEDALGRAIRLDGESYRVVGIMPKTFYNPGSAFTYQGAQFWLPFSFTPEQVSDKGRGNWSYLMIARLRAGATIEQAQQQVDAIQQRNAERSHYNGPSRKAGGFGGIVRSYREQTTEHVRTALLTIQAAVALVLLIACANVANLLLVRSSGRRREIAIRLTLGCGRMRLAVQFFMECLILAFAGGALGILLAAWGLRLFRSLGGDILPNSQAIAVDGPVLGFALCLSMAGTMAAGMIPLAAVWRDEPGDALRDGSTRGSAGRASGLARAALIVAEVAVALILLVAAGLTLRSFVKLTEVRPGFSGVNVLTAQLDLSARANKDPNAVKAFYSETLRRIRALPGVKYAGAISYLPFSENYSTSNYEVRGLEPKDGEPGMNGIIVTVDSTYFQAMRIPLLSGRAFSESDSATAGPVAVIDQFLAKRRFGDRDPIGLEIRCPTGAHDETEHWCKIVGVVGEVRTKSLAEPVSKETLYFPLSQRLNPRMTLVVRTDGDPQALAVPIRKAIRQLDPELPLFDVGTMDQRVADSMASYRSPMVVLLMFGATALILASLGLYGVLAYAVSQRSREIGIRIAIGARNSAILGLVVGQGLRLTLLGLVLGLCASLALTRLLGSLLFGVGHADPLTYAAVSAFLLAVALVACYVPARRATRVNPIIALRAE